MVSKQLAFVASIVAAICFMLTPAKAGTTGGFSGYVLDPAGQPLLDATIGIISLTSKYESHFEVPAVPLAMAVSNAAGFISMLSLPPGEYSFQVRLNDYYFYCPPRIAIDADQSDSLRLNLRDQRLLVLCACQRIVRSQSSDTAYSFDEAGDREAP